MFIDESAANEHTSDRKYSWAPVGVTTHISRPFKCSECWSVLPVYTVDSFIIWEIVHGLFTVESFENVIENESSTSLQSLSTPMVRYCHRQCSNSSIRGILMIFDVTYT